MEMEKNEAAPRGAAFFVAFNFLFEAFQEPEPLLR